MSINRRKLRSHFRHIFACASGIFPLAAAFILIRALLFELEPYRKDDYKLALGFFVAGMISLMCYAFFRADKLRRKEKSESNRLMRQAERRKKAGEDH